MHIDTATMEDIPQLCILLVELFSQEAEFNPDPEVQSEGLKKIISSPETGHVIVAREGNDIIGHGKSFVYRLDCAGQSGCNT